VPRATIAGDFRQQQAARLVPIYVVLTIVLLNMSAYRGSKVLVTLFAVDLGVPQFWIGALVAVYSVFPVLLGLYAGRLTDRLGVRVPMIAGTLGVTTALLVPFFFPGVPALYVSSTLIGGAWVFYNVCAQNLIGILSRREARARDYSNFGLVMAGGSFFGPMISGFSIDHFGHTQTYLYLAALPLTSALIMLALRSVPKGLGKGKVSEEHETYAASLLGNKPLRRTLITSAIVLTGTDLFQFYMPIYGSSIGLSASAIGIILGTFAVAAFVVRVVMPTLVKRWTADTVLLWAMFIGGASYLVFPFFGHAVLLAALAFILGLGLGCSQPLTLMLIYDRAPAGRSGEALGLRLTINNLMHIFIPLFFGGIGSLFNSAAAVFLANAAIMTAGGVLSRRRRDGK
jgi:MFS family permease